MSSPFGSDQDKKIFLTWIPPRPTRRKAIVPMNSPEAAMKSALGKKKVRGIGFDLIDTSLSKSQNSADRSTHRKFTNGWP
jgi:hypothetical protein